MENIDPATQAEQIIDLILALTLTFYSLARYFLLGIRYSLLVTRYVYRYFFAARYYLLMFSVDASDDDQLNDIQSSCKKVLFPLRRNGRITKLLLCSRMLERLVHWRLAAGLSRLI